MRSSPPKKHANLPEAIKETAWAQIAENGAAAISLRAIARSLSITAPAIYNYFARRDDLVTALIVDAYTSLGDWQYAALDDLPEGEPGSRLSALGYAYRTWAVTFPQRYQLIFGTPIPGYVAPEEITLPVAARSLTPLIQTLQSALVAGSLRTDWLAQATPALQGMLGAWQNSEGGSATDVLYLALIIWSRLHGLVMLEIGNHIPAFIHEPGELFQRELATLIGQFF